MAMNALRHAAKHSRFMKFIIGGFIFLAVGGLVFMDVGGYFRGGLSNTTVAVVGDTKIDIREFDQSLRPFLMQANMSAEDAYQAGLIDAFLETRIDGILLAQEAQDLNLNISNRTVARTLQEGLGNQELPDGVTLKNQLEATLRAQGISEQELAASIRGQLQMAILQKLPVGVTEYMPASLSGAYNRLYSERRSGEIITFPTKQLVEDVEISAGDIEAYYEENREEFAIPEERVILIGELTTDMLEDSLPVVSDEDLRAEYEARREEFVTPARRIIAQAVVKDEEQAAAVYELAANGTPLAEALEDVTGDDSGYREAAPYAQGDLPADLAAPAFDDAVTEGKVIEPVQTLLGWHVMAVQSIEPESLQPFDEVKTAMRDQSQKDALYNLLFERLIEAEDMQNAGENYDAIAEAIGLETQRTESLERDADPQAMPRVMRDVLALSPGVMDEIFALEQGRTAYPVETENGFVIFGVANIREKSYRDPADVRDEIVSRLEAQRTDELARAKLAELAASLNGGEAALANVIRDYNGATESFEALSRNDEAPDADTVFSTPQGKFQPYVTGEDSYALITVTDIAQSDSPEAAAIVTDELKMLHQSAFDSVERRFMRENTQIRINEELLEQQYAGVAIE